MSFKNTITPLKPTKKPRYKVTTVKGKRGAQTLKLTPEQEAEFIRIYPTTFNERIMELFGLSSSTVHRMARKLGVKKDMAVILKKHGKQIKRINEESGYYETLRGRRVSAECLEAYKKKLATGWNPTIDYKKKHPILYRRMMKRIHAKRRATIERDKRRQAMGLGQLSNMHIPLQPYTSKQLCRRLSAKRRGYIVGSIWEETGERFVIYYTQETKRAPQFEKNCINDGFMFERATPKQELKTRKAWNEENS